MDGPCMDVSILWDFSSGFSIRGGLISGVQIGGNSLYRES